MTSQGLRSEPPYGYGELAVGSVSFQMYAVTYVHVEEDLFVEIGLGSDDAVQVLFDSEEIHLNSIGRAAGGSNEVQDILTGDIIPQLDPLTAGVHKIMVKVFEGGGNHRLRLRFQEPFSDVPITEGITVCLSPDPAECGQEDRGPVFVRGDANADGNGNIADAVFLLNSLFGGGGPPPCEKAADGNDDAAVNVTDGIYILSALFGGGPTPPAPFPDCGVDPTADELSCEAFAACR